MYDLCIVIGRREAPNIDRMCRRIVRVEIGSDTRITGIDSVEVAPIDVEKDIDSVLYILSEVAPEIVTEGSTIAVLPEKSSDVAWLLAGALVKGSRGIAEVL